MFLFHHSQQNDSNRSYYKGFLFERLLASYLHAAGYNVELRRKHNSLEYDLEGEHRTTGAKVIGEAKAYNIPITGEAFTAFAGKLIPLGLYEKKITGLFLATSALTPEADDFYHQVQKYGLIAKTGAVLQEAIRLELHFPLIEPLAQQLEDHELRYQTNHILQTDNDTYLVLVAGADNSEAPAFFAVYQRNGRLLSDTSFLTSLRDTVSELQSLEPVVDSIPIISHPSRVIPKGLSLGTDWVDYRLPAAPSFFVGRSNFLRKSLGHIQQGKSPNIIQIKSRSGVGKSSALAFMEHQLSRAEVITELHDARDIKSVLDVYSVIQRFCGSSEAIEDFRAVEKYLDQLRKNKFEKMAVFMVDQFESTFTNPDVFQAYESLASLILRHTPNIYMVIARKNDQLTTYDDSKISLERINELSLSFELHDFETEEAADLIHRINAATSRPVGKDVLAYVLEFAQGFPWLIKRTMAHVIRLVNEGVSQRELFATGLKLDDLFDEELAVLDEIERDYLTRIAWRLPADYNQLQRQFDEDPLLPKVLDKLTRARLLRLTGATYDTYNDVFKEYLIYRKLPEFRQAVIYRLYPNGVISLFHKLVMLEIFSNEDLEKRFKITRGSVFNIIRELRNLNLIRREGDGWRIPQSLLDTYHQGRLGDYIRRQVADNDVVSRLVNRVAKGDEVSYESISKYLKQQFPFVEASNRTWETYAAILRSWLSSTRLLETNDNGNFIIPPDNRAKIIEDLGNLTHLATTTRHEPLAIFLPNVPIEFTQNVLDALLRGESLKGARVNRALTDLRNGGWLLDDKISISSIDEFHQQAVEILMNSDYQPLWHAAKNNEPLLDVFKIIVGDAYTEQTLRWRLKNLLNWGKVLGIISKKRYRYAT